jgi:hypothetical protein
MTLSIAELNDAFRKSLFGGNVYLTRGISALSIAAQNEIVGRVRTFDAFGPDNDPYGEHDFGSFEYSGQTIVPSNKAASARRTRRVLVPARYVLAISASAASAISTRIPLLGSPSRRVLSRLSAAGRIRAR